MAIKELYMGTKDLDYSKSLQLAVGLLKSDYLGKLEVLASGDNSIWTENETFRNREIFSRACGENYIHLNEFPLDILSHLENELENIQGYCSTLRLELYGRANYGNRMGFVFEEKDALPLMNVPITIKIEPSREHCVFTSNFSISNPWDLSNDEVPNEFVFPKKEFYKRFNGWRNKIKAAVLDVLHECRISDNEILYERPAPRRAVAPIANRRLASLDSFS